MHQRITHEIFVDHTDWERKRWLACDWMRKQCGREKEYVFKSVEKKNAHPIRTTFTMQFSNHISLQSANQNVRHQIKNEKKRRHPFSGLCLIFRNSLQSKVSERARAWQANERKRRVWRTIRFTSYYLQKESFCFYMLAWFRQGIFQTISLHYTYRCTSVYCI